MANKENRRRNGQQRRSERRPASCCAGEGHNGAIGRSKWKRLANRANRRANSIDLMRGDRRKYKRPEDER